MAEYRQWRNEDRAYLKDVIPLDTPYNLKVEVSSLCNARCVYCAHSKPDHGVYEGNMSLELMERIIEQSKEFPHKYKVMEMFSFGESMCNPNLEQMISMAKEVEVADIAIADVPDGEKKFKEIFGPIADSIFIEKIIPIYADIDYNTIDGEIYEKAINGRENIKQKEIHTVCNRPFYRFRVAADGKVTAACCDIPNDFCFGNIYEDSLVNIWNGENRRRLLKMQLEGRRFQHPICKQCTIPNDITTEADILDPWAGELISRI